MRTRDTTKIFIQLFQNVKTHKSGLSYLLELFRRFQSTLRSVTQQNHRFLRLNSSEDAKKKQ